MMLTKFLHKNHVIKTTPEDDEVLLSLDQYMKRRDWSGACTLLQCRHGSHILKEPNSDAAKWKAYAHLHNGQFNEALEIYTKQTENNSEVFLNCAVCYYYMGQHEKAIEAAQQGSETTLRTRLLMHCEDRLGNSNNSKLHRLHLSESVEDQLSLAALHTHWGNYEDAVALYKQILTQNEHYFAVEFYLALCYSKLEFFDIALEHIETYLERCPDSICGVNMKSCILYKLNGSAEAKKTLQSVFEQTCSSADRGDILTIHNMAVFGHGNNALEVWQSMKSTLLEAHQNLIIWHLSHKNYSEAEKLSQYSISEDITSRVLQGLANMCVGQENESMEHLRKGQEYLQLIGASELHCDTVLGRQCIALCFMLSRQFEDALVYLKSIRDYVPNDDTFRWNYGLTLAETGRFLEAQVQLEGIQNDEFRAERCYLERLVRCYIANGKAEAAWDLYLENEGALHSTSLLHVIANDCYITGAFLISARAFDALCSVDSNPDHAVGKRGAIVGTFRAIVTQQAPTELIDELLQLARHKAQYIDEMDHVIGSTLWNWASTL